jgi:CheY-like chemotaxis protein
MNNEKYYILCVDDDPMNLDLLEAFLEDDYEIRSVADGQQCLDEVAQRRPDLILMDIMMPVMGGREACKRLKASEQTNAIPIIILSGRSFPEDIKKIYDKGADSYLSKPFSEEQLLTSVRAFLHN